MKKLHQGGCHCGAVRFECRLDPAEGTSRCNCSVCAKGRFWKAIARKEDFRILQGENELSDYQFGSRNIHHLFCRHCGIKPFGRGHMDALGGTFYAVNVAASKASRRSRWRPARSSIRTANMTPGTRRQRRRGTSDRNYIATLRNTSTKRSTSCSSL